MNTNNTHNKKFGVIFIECLPWNGFRLIFWFLAELKLFDLNYFKRYHYPAPILKKRIEEREVIKGGIINHFYPLEAYLLIMDMLLILVGILISMKKNFGKIYTSAAQSSITKFIKFVNLALPIINASFQKL